MDNKKNNMKQAMFEMFGVGPDTTADAAAQSPKSAPTPIPEVTERDYFSATVYTPKPKAAATYIAPGTVMEGTLKATGDVEIAGDFKGDITTEGTVILHANIKGNLSVSSLNLSGCTLVGDVVAKGLVTVSADSKILGNITAQDFRCSGQITGDLNITGNTALEDNAQITGNISTGTLSVTKGAMIKGCIETKSMGAPVKK